LALASAIVDTAADAIWTIDRDGYITSANASAERLIGVGEREQLGLPLARFVEAVTNTLPDDARIVKTIGDEVMIVSPDPASLTEWAVGFLNLFQDRPRPRVGIHHGYAVYRDGDYFGTEVNLVHRIVNRALGGEVLVTDRVVDSVKTREFLDFEPIGAVELKGFPEPTPLFIVRQVRGPS